MAISTSRGGVVRSLIACIVPVAMILGFSLVQMRAQDTGVPRLIQFNGMLQTPSGQPMTGVQGVTFALYKDQDGGAPLWVETQNVRADEQGRFAVMLGASAARGVPLELFASGESRWLGVRSDGPDSQEQPRVLLLSVPYALKAADADTIGGKPISAFVLASDGFERGNATANEERISTNGLTASAPTTGMGTNGTITKWMDGLNSVLEDSLIKESGGNVGVGTSGAPNSNLHVQGTGQDVTFNFDNAGAGGHAFRFDSTGNGSVFGAGKLVIQDLNAGGAGRFAIDAEGFGGFGRVFRGVNLALDNGMVGS